MAADRPKTLAEQWLHLKTEFTEAAARHGPVSAEHCEGGWGVPWREASSGNEAPPSAPRWWLHGSTTGVRTFRALADVAARVQGHTGDEPGWLVWLDVLRAEGVGVDDAKSVQIVSGGPSGPAPTREERDGAGEEAGHAIPVWTIIGAPPQPARHTTEIPNVWGASAEWCGRLGVPTELSARPGSHVVAVPATYPHRAKVLAGTMRAKGWQPGSFRKLASIEPKTIQRILDGHEVRQTVLDRLRNLIPNLPDN